MKKFLVLSIIGITMLVAASAGNAKSSYLYPWPTQAKQSFIKACTESGNDIITCGCLVRQLRAVWPWSYAGMISRKATNGDPIPASAMRIMRWAVSRC